MTHRKDGSDQNLNERNLSTGYERASDEENFSTPISHSMEESDADYDDVDLENDELTEEDFDIDGDTEEEDKE